MPYGVGGGNAEITDAIYTLTWMFIGKRQGETTTREAPISTVYQGVLNMLNKCTLTYIGNYSNVSCNNICQQQAKTCVQAFAFDTVSKVTIPYECRWMAGTQSLFCNCCSPLGGNETVNVYPAVDWCDK